MGIGVNRTANGNISIQLKSCVSERTVKKHVRRIEDLLEPALGDIRTNRVRDSYILRDDEGIVSFVKYFSVGESARILVEPVTEDVRELMKEQYDRDPTYFI